MVFKFRFCMTLWISSVLLASLTVCRTHADEMPNIIVILADDLGYGDLSSFGARDLRTPHIDNLVTRGMRFDNFYANCPVCSPTRASLLTGRYPELAGVPGVIRTHAENSWGFLSPNTVLLPEMLKRAGYQTAIVGKWHLGLESPNLPNERGFDFFRGFLGDMMDDYYHHRRHQINYMRHNEEEIDPEGHATDLFSQWACESVRRKAGADQPFFLYLPYNAPHTPIQPPDDWLRKVRQREPEMDEKRARLVALIEHMDDGIGAVIDAVKESGVEGNTLVVFTSDNGGQVSVGANNGNVREGKGTMYEGGLKVPACVVWPKRVAAGTKSDRLVVTMDLYPTLCEAAGVKIGHTIDGISFLATLLGQHQSLPERDVFFHRREGGAAFGGLAIRAVRRGDWKLVQNSPFAPLELYNLGEDPLEEHDLSTTRRRESRDLSAALRRHIQREGTVPWQPPSRRELAEPEAPH
jgi:arylsulfatase A-like enzyme